MLDAGIRTKKKGLQHDQQGKRFDRLKAQVVVTLDSVPILSPGRPNSCTSGTAVALQSSIAIVLTHNERAYSAGI
jgi:hypothetical protein